MKFSFLTHLVYDFKTSHIIGNFLKFESYLKNNLLILPRSLISRVYDNARQK